MLYAIIDTGVNSDVPSAVLATVSAGEYAIATVGVIGIARGLCLMRDTPNQPMQFSRGIVHLVGGIIAVNLVTFLRGICGNDY